MIFVLQILLVTFTGLAFEVYPYFGLTVQQWGISVLISIISDFNWFFFTSSELINENSANCKTLTHPSLTWFWK